MDSPDFNQRLQSMEKRLAAIENRLNISTAPSPAPKAPPAELQIARPERIAATPSISSTNWLGIVAIICFVLAGGFIIKLSIDTGWLTHTRQIGLAALLGFALIGTGLKLLEIDRGYASLLPAAGIIILYLATFAAYRLYSLIPFEMGMMLSSAISLLCICLYLRIRHDVYPITAALGAYLGPIILGFETNAIFTLYYFVVCSLTFAIISVWVRTRTLTLVAAYLSILLTTLVGDNLDQNNLLASLLTLHFLIFSIGTYVYTRVVQPLTENEAWCFFPVLLIFYVAEYYFLEKIQPDLAPWLSLAFATFLMLLYLLVKKAQPTKNIASQTMLFSFVAIVYFHSGYLELMPADAGAWLFIAILCGFALLGSRLNKENTVATLPFIMALVAILGVEYLKLAWNLITNPDQDIHWLATLLGAASIWFVFVQQGGYFKKDEGFGYALLSTAHLLIVLELYRFMDPHGSLAVSASWLLYAVGVIVAAFVRKDRVMANSALLILGFAAGKALLYDASSAPTTIRILCLLLTGAVLYGAGLLFKKIAQWK